MTNTTTEPSKPAAAQEAVAYLDIGAGGYLDLGSNLPEVQLLALPKGRHALGIIGTYGIDGYAAAPVAAAPVDTWFADQLTAMGEVTSLASTPAVPGIDPADPWRGLYAPELMPKLDGVDAYHVAHPDLPSWPKGEDEERGVSPLVKAQGFELEAVFGEYPEDDDEDPDYCAWLAQWQPTPPTGEHWRLVCIQDTEDGPAAFFVRPFALTDASPKGGSAAQSDFGAMTDLLTRWRHNAAIESSPLQAGKVRREVWAQCLSELEAALQATSAEVGA